MSTQLTGASAKILFESPAQLNLKKKLLVEGNFEIVSSGPESATSLDKGITIVKTKELVGRDAVTDEPIYSYKEFPIKHPRENIADVLRRRLPRDAKGLLTVPGITDASIAELNDGLEEFGIYLEPEEFTITQQGEAAFILRAKPSAVIFYGKISFTNTDAVVAPLEVYEAEEGEEEIPTTPSNPETGNGSQDPTAVTITNAKYDEATFTVSANVTGVDKVTLTINSVVTEPLVIPVTNGKINYKFLDGVGYGFILNITAGDVTVDVVVPAEGGSPEAPGKPEFSNLTYNVLSNKIMGNVTNALEVTIKTNTGLDLTTNVVGGQIDYTFNQSLPAGTVISISAKDVEEIITVPSQPTEPTDPVDPVDPIDPVDPEVPGETTQPVLVASLVPATEGTQLSLQFALENSNATVAEYRFIRLSTETTIAQESGVAIPYVGPYMNYATGEKYQVFVTVDGKEYSAEINA